MKKILVTSALPYVNNVPHLGNLIGAVLSADVYARFAKSKYGQENVLYICGADEHGTTTEIKAKEENLTPQALCDKYYTIHKNIYDWFNIQFDIFGRTTHKTQIKNTQAIFTQLYNNGYIVEDELEQPYDEKAKKFLADRYVEGTCPKCKYEDARGDQCDNCGSMLNPKDLINPVSKITGTTPIIKKVKHLFLDLEKLQPQLESWLNKQSKEGAWAQNAINITKGWMKEGLKKRCITRDLLWGVPVPLKGWEHKVFYVWFDAPIGYISITEQLLKEQYLKWWQNPDVQLIQFMGKDNIPFHTILFPATLIGTKQPWNKVHHLSSTDYLNYENGKFSKSRNTGVFGDDAKKTGIPADAYRYYLLSIRPETSDTQFTWEDFGARINNELVANIANLVNRTITFINKFTDGTITNTPQPQPTDETFWQTIKEKETKVTQLLEEVKLRDALKTIMEIASVGNSYFQASEPWKTIKEDKTKAETALYYLANLCKDLAILLQPYLPATSKKLFTQLNSKEQPWTELGNLTVTGKIKAAQHLFNKIEDKQIKELKEAYSGKQNNDLETFKTFDLRVAKIERVEQHPDADKLYIEHLDLGPLGKRQIVSGLKGHYEPEALLGKNIVIVANLKPAKLRGVTSEGMLLAAENKQVGIVLAPEARPGEQVLIAGVQQTPTKEIDIKTFFSIQLKANKGLYLQDKELLINSKSLLIDKDVVGNVK